MTRQEQTPRVLPAERAYESDHYPSGDDPTNYSPGVEDLGLTRSLDDPKVWRGEINLEGRRHQGRRHADLCMQFAVWVSGLDVVRTRSRARSSPLQKWIDLKDKYMREFNVTAALGTNGTVRTLRIGGEARCLGTVSVPSGAWPERSDVLVGQSDHPPLLSTDPARYLREIPGTAYHLEVREREGGSSTATSLWSR